MENEVLIGSNSDIIIEKIANDIRQLDEAVIIRVVDDMEGIESLGENQLVIVDLSVYSSGIIDRIERFKKKFPAIELIAITYTGDDCIDQMLITKGVDQVASKGELTQIVETYFLKMTLSEKYASSREV